MGGDRVGLKYNLGGHKNKVDLGRGRCATRLLKFVVKGAETNSQFYPELYMKGGLSEKLNIRIKRCSRSWLIDMDTFFGRNRS